MFKILTLTFFLLSVSLISHATDETSLVGKFRLESNEVLENSPVTIEFTLKNELNERIEFALIRSINELIRIELKDKEGVQIALPPKIKNGIKPLEKIMLNPGEVYSHKIVLNDFLEKSNYEQLIPGEYDVRLIIDISKDTYEILDFEEEDSLLKAFIAMYEHFPNIEQNLNLIIIQGDESNLDKLSEDLSKKSLFPSSTDEAKFAAEKLSFVNNPVAIPYLQEIILSKPGTLGKYAVDGLIRINTKESIQVLISTVNAPYLMEKLGGDSIASTPAIVALGYLERVKNTTNDSGMIEDINNALSTYMNSDLFRKRQENLEVLRLSRNSFIEQERNRTNGNTEQ